MEFFWCRVGIAYPLLGEYVLRFLIPFSSTYLCESGFSSLLYLKNKYRNKLDVEKQLVISLSKIKPRIQTLIEKHFNE